MFDIVTRASVALFARAWIEIVSLVDGFFADTSPSLRGRGLKWQYTLIIAVFAASPSLRGRGLK